MERQRWEESEKRRAEERRSEKRKSEKKEDAGARKGSKLAKHCVFFPECVARIPVSLWGSGGWGCDRSTLPNRPQPSATVRNRPQPSATVRNRPQLSATVRAIPIWPCLWHYGKFCKRGHFWRFHKWRCFVTHGRRGTSWHSDVFCNVSKVVLCGRRNTFATFSQDVLQFSWQVQHFGRVHRHFAWQAQHFRCVVLRVFPKYVARVPVSLWGSGGWGCVRSTLRLRPQPFATIRNRSQPSAKPSATAATVRNRPREDHMPVPMVSSAEGVIFGGFTCGVASFCVAGVAPRDIQTCFVTCRKSFCQAQYFSIL